MTILSIRTGNDVIDLLLEVISGVGLIKEERCFHTAEILPSDDIDYTSNRVSTVQG